MKILKSLKKLTNCRFVNLFSIDFQDKDKTFQWQFASRKQEPILGEKLTSDAVVIVPILSTENGNKLVVIKEFRIPIWDYSYSFPAGCCESGEDVVATAKRELKEETGLEVTEVGLISPPIISSAGLSDESVTLVFVKCDGVVSTTGNEGCEDIEVDLLDYNGVVNLMESTEVKHCAKMWQFLCMFKLLGKIELPK